MTGPPVFAKRKVFTCFTADTKPAPNFLASGAEESEEKSIERFICCHQVISVAFKIMGEYIRADIPAESECGSLAARGYRAGNHDFHLIPARRSSFKDQIYATFGAEAYVRAIYDKWGES